MEWVSCVSNGIRLAVFVSLYLRDRARRTVLLVRCSFLAAAVDRFYPSNTEDAYHIHAVVLSYDVSDGDSIDDLTECDGNFVETREGDLESAEDSTSDNTAAMKWTLLTDVSLERAIRSGVR